MSAEAPKTVEAPVVAPTSVEAPFTETPAVVKPTETEAVAEPSTETPAVTELAPAEEVAAPAKEEVKPVEEGVLGYKGPGLLKSFIFQKKFFWFGTDAVETKALSSYLRGEKDTAAANHNAAWASHTGKGLLFFSKKATDKASPAGLFNLSDVADIAEEGHEFHFVSGGHKHTFQASSVSERENWVAVLKSKVEEAKTLGETVKDTEEYKKSHTALTPAVAAPVVAAAKKVGEPKTEEPVAEAVKEEKKEEKKEIKEEKKEIKEEKKEEKKARKSRSASRKRASIFGGFGKKDTKEEKVEAKEEAASSSVPAVEEPVVAPVEPTPVAETPAVIEPIAPVVAEEPTTATEATPKPTPSKRNSIFGTLKSQFSNTKEKKTPEAPIVPAKDTETEPVSETAPVIPQVESTEPLPTTVATPEVTPAEPVAPITNGETKTAETPVTKTDKRKSSLPWLSKKEKPTSDDDTEKPKSPFAKLRATVKGKSSPKAEKTPEVKPEETKKDEETVPTVASTEEPVVAAPVPAVPATTPQVTASA
ncbi:PH [Glarea lozoyensis ATCC 20868]|uniref:PH n=2 Tax=Glarea lozoyensis TaxID=101852 RepID=S3D5L5_GLAL2|nr:PH [Glarea lozoyensis ATCC 20868]EHK96247.1 hypothetical protein M7I_8069 [Glarea lozoyensis 74030]EPE32409.1 PH [Glarea lozoyensis ATCC 20868]